MSCCVHVICSDTSCFPEIAGDLGVCVPPMDVEKVKGKIMRLANDEAYRNRLAERCCQRAAEFSWSESAKLYHQTFAEVLKRNK